MYITLFIILMTASVSNVHFQRDDVLSEATVDPIKTQKLREFLQTSSQLTPAFQENQFKTEMRDHTNQLNHRSLSAASAVNSVVAGLGSSSMFTGDTLSITVTAKDSSGNLLTTGGDIFTVKISNLCTIYNAYYCKPTGATSPLSANVNDVMIDHNNGTYTYSYTLSVVGSVSVQVYLLTQGQVYQEYYSGSYWAGTSTKNCIQSNLSILSASTDTCITSTNSYSNYIIGAILSPTTGNITFGFQCDDGCIINIDDIQHLNAPCPSSIWGSFSYFNISMEINKYYTFYMKYCQISGGYAFKTKWSYSSLSSVSIPMSNVFLPNLVSSSPYTINVALTVCGDQLRTGTETCDDGNTASGDGCSSTCTVESGYACMGGSSTSKDTCIEICGDGIRFNSILIYCDDGNTASGDGCSSTCTVESGYTCIGGTSTTKDICTEICGDGIRFNKISTYCDDGNIVSGDGCNSTCTLESDYKCSGGSTTSKDICSKIEAENTKQQIIGGSVFGVTLIITFIFSLCKISTPQKLWISMNQFQMILLLLLTKSNIPMLIVSYLTGLKATTCSFNFIPFKNIPGLNQLVTYLDIPLSNSSLDYFGVFSGSSFTNNFALICIIICVTIIEGLIILIIKLCKKKTKSEKFLKFSEKVYQLFVFSIYVRIFLEVNMFIVMSSTSEINEWKTKTTSNIISLAIAILCALICTGFIVISFLFWIQYRKYDISKRYIPLKEFINGVKNKPIARLFSTLFLIRRSLFVSFLIFGSSIGNTFIISTMIVAQVIYLVIITIIRPFEETKDNFIKISNECFYLLLISLLSHFNTPDRWTETVQYIYLYIIIANSFTIISIIIISFAVLLSRKLKVCCLKSNVAPKEHENKTNGTSIIDFSNFKISNKTPSASKTNIAESSIAIHEEAKSQLPVQPLVASRVPSDNELYWQNYDQIKGGKRVNKFDIVI